MLKEKFISKIEKAQKFCSEADLKKAEEICDLIIKSAERALTYEQREFTAWVNEILYGNLTQPPFIPAIGTNFAANRFAIGIEKLLKCNPKQFWYYEEYFKED